MSAAKRMPSCGVLSHAYCAMYQCSISTGDAPERFITATLARYRIGVRDSKASAFRLATMARLVLHTVLYSEPVCGHVYKHVCKSTHGHPHRHAGKTCV